MSFEILKKHATFGGETIFAEHKSAATKTVMKFSAYLPRDISEIDNAIIWLSGLTCNEENFITKAGAQRYLANTNTMIICPDTSPRGLEIKGADESYDFGTGAGFYVNATSEGYEENYQMYDYITRDLAQMLESDFGIKKMSIMGHSMGGHGALVIGLNNSERFRAISAFSPIVNPINCPWGQKALSGYLGDDKSLWSQYDACELIKSGKKSETTILIDQGLADEFFESELKTKNFEDACRDENQKCEVHYREGYDHSYYFISSFIGEHIDFHIKNF
jgi:S-formylglutathione hydrolase